jgi:iron(III) transport system substrate-binding protein
LNEFQKKYPFIQPELFRLGPESLHAKVLTEAKAGRHIFDVKSTNVVQLGLLMRDRYVAPYLALEREGIPAGLKDKEGYWTAMNLRPWVLAYNTKMVSAKEAPRDWWDLMEPKWKRAIGMEEDETEWYAALSEYWGKEKAQKFMRGLAGQNPWIRSGHNLVTQLNGAGEFPLSISLANRVEEMKGQGAPIDWVDTTDPVILGASVIALSFHASHPNAGRLLIEYVLSREGQTILRKFDRIPAHKDIQPLSPKLDPKKLKTFLVNPKIAERYNDYYLEFRSFFAGKEIKR